MSRYRFVRTAYPTNYWHAHGEEILDTANELNDNGWSLRESRHLLAHGLRTRSLEATNGSIKHMLIQSVVAVLWLSSLSLVTSFLSDTLRLSDVNLIGMTVWLGFFAIAGLFGLTRSTGWLVMLAVGGAPALLLLNDVWLRTQNGILLSMTLSVAAAIAVAVLGDERPFTTIPWTFAALAISLMGAKFGIWLPSVLPLALVAVGILVVMIEPRALAIAAVHATFVVPALFVDESVPGMIWPIAICVAAAATLGLSVFAQSRLRKL